MKRCALLEPKSEQTIVCSGCDNWLVSHSWDSEVLLSHLVMLPDGTCHLRESVDMKDATNPNLLTVREAREIAQEETNG